MTTDWLLPTIAQLASLEYQNKYIVHGTADEYLLPEELVGNAEYLIEKLLNTEQTCSFSDKEVQALKELLSTITSSNEDILLPKTRAELLENISSSEEWSNLRKKSYETLRLFGIDLEKLTPKQIDEGSFVVAQVR